MEQKALYDGQVFTLTRFWATRDPCLWIMGPQQIGIPKIEFVGEYPGEYLKNLTETELLQITSLGGAPLDVETNYESSNIKGQNMLLVQNNKLMPPSAGPLGN